MTYFAEHGSEFSHDAVNRLLRRDRLTSRLVWEHVKGDIVASPNGCLIFDDTIIDKNHVHHIDLARLQYRGNAHGLIKGIGMVNCLYVNPDSGQYWIIDYRLYDPERDGKDKHGSCLRDAHACLVGEGFALKEGLQNLPTGTGCAALKP